MADVMTPVEVEDNRKRAVNLLEAAKLICATLDRAGYYFADEPAQLCDNAIAELDGIRLSEVNQRYGELLYQQREDEVEEYRDLKRRENRDFVGFGE